MIHKNLTKKKIKYSQKKILKKEEENQLNV